MPLPKLKVPASSKHIAIETLVGGTYKVLEVLGEGGMGTVYRVEQVFLQQQYAMKTLHANLSDEFLRRFQREAQAASRLVHPNLVRAYYFGMTEDGEPYFIMDLIQGQTLSELLAQVGTISLTQALEIFLPVCSALAVAHQQGVIHRDLKPSNIMLALKPESPTKTVPMVVDFGIARIVEGATEEMTKTGEVFGTPLYMSPEQSMGRKVDQRSDIYSLACVIFHALTGAPPFCGESALATMMMHNNQAVPSLKEASMGVQFPPKLEAAMAKALAKDPAERYQSCDEFAAALDAAARIGATNKTVDSAAALHQSNNKSKRKLVTLVTALSIAAVCAVVAAMFLNVQHSATRIASPSTNNITTTHSVDPSTESDHSNSENRILPTDHSFFSEVVDKDRVFHFPQRLTFGTFSWRDRTFTDYKLKAAEGVVRIPVAAKVIFQAGPYLVGNPSYASCFQNGDMEGLIIMPRGFNRFVDKEYVDLAIFNLMSIDSIRLMVLKNFQPKARTFSKIGDLPHLSWLALNNTKLNSVEVANLKNLGKLKVLRLNKFDGVTPILKQLQEQNAQVVRLSLESCSLSPKDFALISKLQTVQVLDLNSNFDKEYFKNDEERLRVIRNLAKLPRLETLTIDGEVIGEGEATLLGHCKKLRTLCVSWKVLKPAQQAQLKKVLPHCQIIDAATPLVERIIDKQYFSPAEATRAPGTDDLW